MSALPELPIRRPKDEKTFMDFINEFKERKTEVTIDPNENILVTGRPNAGTEDFKTLLAESLTQAGTRHAIVTISDITSAKQAVSSIKTPNLITIVDDPDRLLFSAGLKPQDVMNLIYITTHWNLGRTEYEIFDRHVAFAAARNEDLNAYPYPFSVVGNNLDKGEFVIIDSQEISDVSSASIN